MINDWWFRKRKLCRLEFQWNIAYNRLVGEDIDVNEYERLSTLDYG
jgi:hypothetical protein